MYGYDLASVLAEMQEARCSPLSIINLGPPRIWHAPRGSFVAEQVYKPGGCSAAFRILP